MNQIAVFTDGSSRGNPGPGGWASVIISDEKVVELGGAEKNTTNNRMELMAVIQGLRKASEVCGKVPNDAESSVEAQDRSPENEDGSVRFAHGLPAQGKFPQIKIYSDSSYVINGITKWIHGWKRNGWKTKSKDNVLNKDLWMALDDVLDTTGSGNVSWERVGGHIGVAGNERCDVIATTFADGEIPKLYDVEISAYPIKNILNILPSSRPSIRG